MNLARAKDALMKLKLFSTQSGNRKPTFDALETEVNSWLDDHPGIVIEHTSFLSQPNMQWSHLALAVWYAEK
jgi:hypothetical protein